MNNEQIHFVTGRLAEFSLRALLSDLAPKVGFEYTMDVLPITVAALMTPDWIAKRIQVPPATTRVLIPGYCDGDLAPIGAVGDLIVERGPRDLRGLPEFFGQADTSREDYGQYDIEILAEINHAPRLAMADLLAEAAQLREAGADLIDVGCEPGDAWSGVADCVKALRDEGYRVSIDSLNPAEIAPAVKAGAELVLSVNSTNREAAVDWGCEVVVIPDDFATLGGLDETVQWLASHRVPLRIDPVLEPIGFDFARSLGRYLDVRGRYPDAEMMMGIGNLTELTEADSAGLNVLLLGVCQELGIRSVLTTQVINWARTSVRECDLARRLVHYAIENKVVPKHLDSSLVMLRDPRVYEQDDVELNNLAETIKDNNFRLFVSGGKIHLISAGIHLAERDPFLLFDQMRSQRADVDQSHAFYLGYEMAKAVTALTLGKNYAQDEALDWGLLTKPEESHRLRKSSERQRKQT